MSQYAQTAASLAAELPAGATSIEAMDPALELATVLIFALKVESEAPDSATAAGDSVESETLAAVGRLQLRLLEAL